MSRVGKNPVPIPSGVTVDVKPQEVSVKGPKGNLSIPVRSEVKVTLDGD
jgi:large subunit ribosomal protein L6